MELNYPNFDTRFDTLSNKEIIWLDFAKKSNLIAQVKSIKSILYSEAKKAWYLNDNSDSRNLLFLKSKSKYHKILLQIHPKNQNDFLEFIKYLQLNQYSANSIKTYANEFGQFLNTIQSQTASKLKSEHLKSYFLYCSEELKMSENHLHSRINAIKIYFEQVLVKAKTFVDIPRPQKKSVLKTNITDDNIGKMLEHTSNTKHRVIIVLCCELGFKISEIIQIKSNQIDFKKRILEFESNTKQSKNIQLSSENSSLLKQYIKEYKPEKYLLEGVNQNQFSTRAAQVVLKNALKKANIRKKIGVYGAKQNIQEKLQERGADLNIIHEMIDVKKKSKSKK